MEHNDRLDDLIRGIGVIANVMLVGQTSFGDDEKLTTKHIELFSSMCEMTSVYADHLQKVANDVEKNQHIERQAMIRSIDSYKEGLALKKYRETGELSSYADTRKEAGL
ncbi:hypothetical protein [Lactococcus garvieae]|uniref:Uncharacterized protein n=1 Tax=Lactococcus garvieae TaxID=1363 RepID=A0AAX3NCG7_9LACT|nr:hypothetical protein [Lactococcus garvieae]WEA13299.1 hypothetical protein PWF74_07085 [Lactococcus garvieae]